jgi:hypothetical protein
MGSVEVTSMLTGKVVKAYITKLIHDLDLGRRPMAPRWIRTMAIPAALGLSMGMGGCLGEEPTEDTGMELIDGKADGFGSQPGTDSSCLQPPEICNDGEDNDLDGFIDCLDHDCLEDDACSATVLYAGPMEQDCENGIDDDGDGEVDCADGDCNGTEGYGWGHCACT